MLKNVKNRIIPTILVIIFSVTISIIPAYAKTDEVILGGDAFGLKLYCKGVMITRFESFTTGSQKICPAKSAGLKVNDIILKANNQTIKSNEQIDKTVKNSNGKTITFYVQRNNNKFSVNVKPRLNSENEYYIGLWVRDSCAGIGTITYFNPQDNSYGALGHGICDMDTGAIIPNDQGEILKAKITGITKSENNNIGTLNGYFTDETIGNIRNNSPIGIYGNTVKSISDKNKIKVADSSEIKTGKAQIISTIKGSKSQKYDIEILGTCNNSKNSNRNFIIKITDNRLLKNAGGIVQGMSGSPIIQNNKLVGALTHVFVDDCSKGYGIFARNMIGI